MVKQSAYQAKLPDASGRIRYTASENSVWHDLITRQLPAVQRHHARPYLDGLDRLNFPLDRVPQCGEISEILGALTGWKVSPQPALIPFGKFFRMLSDRTFPAASFIRSRQDFDYIKEPDIFHEIFGHTPLLTDPRFAKFSQAIGEAGMRADKQDYSWLARLYWFTIEFGLTRENGNIKALGSGLASSVSELPYSVESDAPQRRPFDILDILRTPYRIDIHQPIYFVLENVDDLFAAAERDLLADIQQARAQGLHKPCYPPEIAQAS